MSDIVRVEFLQDTIATVRLNRPEKKNAWTLEMFDALTQASGSIADNETLRAVILTGAGGCFSAGLDFSVFGEFAKRLDELKKEMLNPPTGQESNRFQAPVMCWQELPIPVIAAIEGVCFGAGMQLALAADFRIAAPDARFSIMESKWGLIPDMGITQTLPKLMRVDQAKELIMTARILDAEEALEYGLVSTIVDDPVSAATKLAKEFAERSPDAIRAAKRLVDESWNATKKDALALEAELQANIIGGANQIEAVMANMQKRPPKFR